MNVQTVSDDELALLLELARDKEVLELGTWYGESTLALLTVAARVWTVDWHGGQYWQARRTGDLRREPTAEQVRQMMTPAGGWSLPGFLQRTAEAQATHKLVALVGPTHVVLTRLLPAGFELVFQDADHSAEGVAADLKLALPLLSWDGWIAVHDYGLWGVKAGAERVLGPPDQLVRSLAVWGPNRGRWRI